MILAAVVVLPYWRSLDQVVRQSEGGMPVGYLAAVPLWCLTIARGRRHRLSRGVNIHDRQLDWTVAGTVGVVSSLALSGAQRRLGDLGLIWRVDLLSWVAWAFVCAVVLYGVRTVATCWPMWLFALACWPAPYLLALSSRGYTAGAEARLQVAFAALAAFLAAEGRIRRVVASGLTAAGAGSISHVFINHSGWALPAAAIAPALAVVVARRVPGPALADSSGTSRAGGAPGRRRTAFRLGSLALGASGVAVTITPPASAQGVSFGPQVHDPDLGSGWKVQERSDHPAAIGYLGRGATLARFRVSEASPPGEVMVDVLDNAPCAGIGPDGTVTFYKGAAALGGRVIKLHGGSSARVRFSNPDSELTPGQAGWVALFWVHRHAERPNQCEQMSFFAPAASAPAIVSPTVGTVIVRPLGILIRQNGPVTAPTDAAGMALAISAANAVLDEWAHR